MRGRNVRFYGNYVRFTPESGHYSWSVFRPLLTHNGHYELIAELDTAGRWPKEKSRFSGAKLYMQQ